MTQEDDSPPERCLLNHQVFTMLGAVSFRRARADGTPVMVVTLGDREAVVPLRALQREFGIGDDSADGRMLGLIAESLDYVCGLSLGDKLPSEVLTGRASWDPSAEHKRLAINIIRLQLLSWIDPEAADPAKGDPLLRLENDPALRQQVQLAFDRAATELGLPDRDAVVVLVQELAGELAYIEALRDRLLRPVRAITNRLERLVAAYRGDSQRQESASRVTRLAITARQTFQERFDELAAQTGEVMSALRNMESQQAFIRSIRDQLYREQRAWQSILDGWAASDPAEEVPWDLIMRTYQFLAPRYMPVTEWTPVSRNVRPTAKQAPTMSW
ncbi:MAG: hypothetical protein NTY94_15355 [Alphaproteobacteria bacterium]|nr:hypothetical protein [Alphaproteobacteria bacterium]